MCPTLLINEKAFEEEVEGARVVAYHWGIESCNGTWAFDLISKIPIWTTPISIQAFPNQVGQAQEIRTHQQVVIVSKIVKTCVARIKNLGGKLVFIAEAEELT